MATQKIGGGAQGAVTGLTSGAAAGASIGGPWGAAIGGIAGGLLGFFGGEEVQAPPTYEDLMKSSMAAQAGIQPELLALEGKYRPKWQSLNEATYNRQLYGGDGTQGYLGMLERLQSGVSGLERKAVLENLSLQRDLTGQARQAMFSPQQQMMADLVINRGMRAGMEGGNLSADDIRSSQQTARAAMTARGLTGRQAVAAEILNTQSAREAREARNMGLLSSALQLESGMQEAGLRQAMGGLQTAATRGQFMGASGVLGATQPLIFQPESQMGAQLAGAQYQHQMGIAQMNLGQTQNMFQGIGQFGSFMIQNPNLFGGGGNNQPGGTHAPSPANVNPYQQKAYNYNSRGGFDNPSDYMA